jgi:hypothetical protein
MNSTNLIEDLRLLSPPRHAGWVLFAAAMVLALGALLLMRYRRNARSKIRPGAVAAGGEPWAEALSALERLVPLLTQEHSREYAIQSTGILRRYIEGRYTLQAPRLATEEFLVLAGNSPLLPADHRAELRRFLELCDLLKFGRYLAPGDELQPLHSAAVAFVLASRPAAAAPSTAREAQC